MLQELLGGAVAGGQVLAEVGGGGIAAVEEAVLPRAVVVIVVAGVQVARAIRRQRRRLPPGRALEGGRHLERRQTELGPVAVERVQHLALGGLQRTGGVHDGAGGG